MSCVLHKTYGFMALLLCFVTEFVELDGLQTFCSNIEFFFLSSIDDFSPLSVFDSVNKIRKNKKKSRKLISF